MNNTQAQALHRQMHMYLQQLEELSGILAQERAALTTRDFDQFQRLLTHKDHLLKEVSALDESLTLLLKTICKNPTADKVTQTLANDTGPLAKTLQLQYRKLQEIANACRRENEIISRIIGHAQQHYGRLKAIFRQENPDAKIYSKDGRHSAGPSNGGRLAQV